MRVLGIDPGLALLGWGLVESDRGNATLKGFGCIETPSRDPLTKRLLKVHDDLTALIEKEKPDVLALETLFFVKNAKTLAQVGHSRGVILLTAGQAGLDLCEYAPSQIKMALTGYGGADKRQMQLMIQRILNLKNIPKPDDAADAVAVALCHAQYCQLQGKAAVTV